MMDSVEEGLLDFKNGKMIIVVDSEDRENEGDFVIAGEKCTSDDVNFMITNGKGLVCVPITSEKASRLGFNLMNGEGDRFRTKFTNSIDYKDVSTGISALERALTISKIVSSDSKEDFVSPGHIFPLIATDISLRQGHTEAAIELCRLSGFSEVGVICEIIKADGEMARVPDLKLLKEKWGMKMISIKDLMRYKNET